MRQGSNPKRLRGRTGRKNPNPRSQNFESNGPEVKVRGNAQQVVEKYLALARDASSAGDRIMAENYFQHAEHYYRIMSANSGGEDRNNQNNQHNQNGHNNRQHGDGEANHDANGAGHRPPIEVVATSPEDGETTDADAPPKKKPPEEPVQEAQSQD